MLRPSGGYTMPPMRSSRTIALLSSVLYAAALLLPVHELFVEEESCVECEAIPGPVYERDCGSSPCDDPQHHHHGGHHGHESCPACAQGKVAAARPEHHFPAAVSEPLALVSSAFSSPGALLFAWNHPARGPPSLS